MKRFLAVIALAAALPACGEVRSDGETPAGPATGTTVGERFEMSESEWREKLTEEQYRIAREGGTERAFTGKYWDTKTPGVYHCAACGQALFPSDTKFESGTGWPSFYRPVEEDAVAKKEDRSAGMVRTEVVCSRCESHLGHVFPDGPEPTGLRYCLNSAVLDLRAEESEESE